MNFNRQFTRRDLFDKVIEEFGTDFTPLKPIFRQAIQASLYKLWDIDKDRISDASFKKLEKDFLYPFCTRVIGFYKEKKTQYKYENMIANHKLFFGMKLPDLIDYLVDPEPTVEPGVEPGVVPGVGPGVEPGVEPGAEALPMDVAGAEALPAAGVEAAPMDVVQPPDQTGDVAKEKKKLGVSQENLVGCQVSM